MAEDASASNGHPSYIRVRGSTKSARAGNVVQDELAKVEDVLNDSETVGLAEDRAETQRGAGEQLG